MITSITLLLHLLLISVAFGKDVCFTDVHLIDSYTRNQNCTDPSHYFLIETQLSIGKGSHKDDDVYLSVPSEFDSFPNLPLNISNNGQLIASIYEKGDNIFGISFPNSFSQDTAINFNILAKLSNSTIDSTIRGGNKTFSFRTTTNNVFNSTIHFVDTNSDSLVTNGGFFSNNNTAWFTADIPVSLLNKAVTFKSVKTGTNNYHFNLSATKLEVVTSVDSQGNPLKTVPFTAYTDKSTDDQIEISIATMISGSAKFVRIYYYTEKLDKTPISYSATLVQANSLKKRDLTDSVTATIYGDNNIDTESNAVVVVSTSTSATSSSMSNRYISAPLYSNNTYTSTSSHVTSTSYTESTVSDSSVSDISMELSSMLITTANSNSSSPATSDSSFSSSSFSSFFPTTTTPLSNTTSIPSLITSGNVIKTYEVYTITNSAMVTEIGSYVAISTIRPTEESSSTTVSDIVLSTKEISNSTVQASSTVSHAIFSTTSSASTVQSFTSNYLNTTSGISSVTTAIAATNTTKSTTKDADSTSIHNYNITIATAADTIDSTNKHTSSVSSNSSSNADSNNLYTTVISGVVVTKILSGDYSVETDLIPISTLSNGNVVNIYKTEVSGSLVTKTMTAINSIYTELVPVTRIYNLTTTISCSTETSSTVITKTQSGVESIATDFSAISTLRNITTVLSSTTTQVGKVVSTTTLSPINSVYNSMVPFTTLTTGAEQQSSKTISATLDALTRSTSTLKTTATIKSSSSSSDTTQLRPTSVTVSSIQIEIPQYLNSTYTTISVVPYEAGSNKLASSVSYFFIALLALLF